ncbi:ankyrin [Massarina eburnea CBS 473.64]|uniref:Ankyrin n=1 Tax=Massarina eburnea CBS 473.64 TaxID=1395130 RepID=A0A6A6RMH7_9PLEO|nr:ankyrin [Massarina eburnea CBS 473.64]
MASSTLTIDDSIQSEARPPVTTSTSNQLPPTETEEANPPSSTSLRSSLSWKSFRSSISMTEKTSAKLGWVIALLSVIFTIITLSPAFKSQGMSEKALELAQWTALKDYIEECREELAAGIQSQACLRAMKANIPPPPYVKPGVLDRMKRGLLQTSMENNSTIIAPKITQGESSGLGAIQGCICIILVLTACMSFFGLQRHRNINSVHSTPTPRTNEKDKDEDQNLFPPPNPPSPPQTTLRYPANDTTTLRHRRPVRSHPIYTHNSLESAIHHSALPEIRLRLQNGEDVNKHWPYLIYKLAIMPPSTDTPKRLEIARLCLDFGADVNALKGWNGQSALMIAIHFGNVSVARLLIVNGATVGYSPSDSNLTALHRCARLAVTGRIKDALDIMTLLLEHGANPSQADRLGETALHKLFVDAWLRRDDSATMKKLEPAALLLIQHGARLPETIKEKYIVGNPLWDAVWCAVWDKEGEKGVWSRESDLVLSASEGARKLGGRREGFSFYGVDRRS